MTTDRELPPGDYGPMRYWPHWHNLRYELDKRIDKCALWLAARMPRRLRMWTVVDATNTARRLYPHPTGYAGPDGLGYSEIYDGALKQRRDQERPMPPCDRDRPATAMREEA